MSSAKTTHGDRVQLYSFDPGELENWRQTVAGTAGPRLRSAGVIGSGGMGQIEAVLDLALKRPLARKVLHPDMQRDPGLLWLFVREARITAQLEHPAIVPLYDVGQDSRGRYYFTMKSISGRSLAEIIDQRPDGPMSRRQLFELLEVLVKVCDAIAFAHARGVVHCDLKPDHIVVGEYGQVYVMDWGIAHVRDLDRGGLDGVGGPSDREPNLVFGTPEYMAPEQASGRRAAIDERTDVFALGAILYDILTQQPPYESNDIGELVAMARRAEYVPLSELAGDAVPPELELITTRAMARRPEDRYRNAVELADALRSFMRGEGQFPTVRFPAGTYIVRQGDPSEAAYIIAKGSCRAYRRVGDQEQELRIMSVGDVFGELALLSGEPRTASVVALEETELHMVTRTVFQGELEEIKPWLSGLVHTLAQRFRGLERE